MKIVFGFLLAVVLYIATMIDMRPITTEKWVDCKVGEYTFTLMAKDCR